MMMPEQNEKVRERNDQGTSESEHPRSEQTRSDETRSDETAYDRMPAEQTGTDETGTDATRTEQLRTEEASSGRMPSGEQTGAENGRQERLVPEDHAASYGSRWDAVKGTFVDEPREAVAQADALVGELLDELETLFREQRRSIEHGLDADETSTEDLRMALRRYRSFFERLLSV
jgi:hypothetical protein